jgi:hypothetical protein
MSLILLQEGMRRDINTIFFRKYSGLRGKHLVNRKNKFVLK